MTFSVALMMKMIVRLDGLRRISSNGLWANEGGFEFHNRVGWSFLVVLVQALCIYGRYRWKEYGMIKQRNEKSEDCKDGQFQLTS